MGRAREESGLAPVFFGRYGAGVRSGGIAGFVAFAGFDPVGAVGGFVLVEVDGVGTFEEVFGAVPGGLAGFDIFAGEGPVRAVEGEVAAADGLAVGKDGLGMELIGLVGRDEDHEGEGFAVDDLLAGEEGDVVSAVIDEEIGFAGAGESVRRNDGPGTVVGGQWGERIWRHDGLGCDGSGLQGGKK